MFTLDTREGVLEDLLNRVGEKLQLDKTRREKAESTYKAVTDYLSANSLIFGNNIEMYPQGSYAIETTVKPKDNEYDLDFVMEVKSDPKISDPIELISSLKACLDSNGLYEGKTEAKNRCVRIVYAGDYHMDIIPAFHDSKIGGTAILVPDRSIKGWSPSNPRGFISWFNSKAETAEIIMKAASADPLPPDISYEWKLPLKRIVQLIKRYRDENFKGNEKAVISIVLTTLAASKYRNEDNVFVGLSSIINDIEVAIQHAIPRIHVENPSNTKEDFAERWDEDPSLYNSFKGFIHDFKTDIKNLESARGLENVGEVLKNMFGENISGEVLNDQTNFLTKAKQASLLGVTAQGFITTNKNNSQSIHKHTYWE